MKQPPMGSQPVSVTRRHRPSDVVSGAGTADVDAAWLIDQADDLVADEVAVALVYNGISHAVMMASPLDLHDFVLGFSLTEGIVQSASEIYGTDVVVTELGIEVRIELATAAFVALKTRRRNLTGRTGCGLCGAESLQQAISRPATVDAAAMPEPAAVDRSLQSLQQSQALQSVTGAVHGAAWCALDGTVLLAREDVGRHNALDKLIGALQSREWRGDRDVGPAAAGYVLVSSRASYEMVSKCTAVGISTLVAVSAPTALAIRHAQQASMNLIGFARDGRHVVYADGLKPAGDI